MPANPSIPTPLSTPAAIERTAVRTALVAGLFCVLLTAGMLFLHMRSKLEDPLKAPQMAALKDQLSTTPKDEPLKQRIRELDLELRRSYFQQLTMKGAGGWMLLIGLCAFLLAAKKVCHLRQVPPMPQVKADPAAQAMRAATQARWSVAVIGMVLALALVTLGLTVIPSVPSRTSDVEILLSPDGRSAGAPPPGPSPADYQSNWPRFRGPGGSGIATHTNVLLAWSVDAGNGLLWKTSVPTAGFNSPVVWGHHIFLSGGDKQKREVLCFEVASGKLLWQRVVENVAGSPGELPDIPDQTGFAAPTMATDGQRAYVIFANGDLAAFTFDGTLAWAKNLGVPRNPHGHASSLTTWQNRLIVQLDQGSAEDRLSKLYALDGATGNLVWQCPRPVGDSWASPIVIEAAGKAQIIALGLPWLIAHDATEGTELWRAECLEGEVTPSPVFANGRLFVVNPNTFLMAIRPDGQGDVSKTHIAWKSEDGIPDITSPVSNGELVFLVSTPGMVTCYDAQDGKKVWEHDYAADFNASPSLVGNRLYLFSVEGAGIVLEAGRTYKELARSTMGEKVFASPAFVQDRMILRGAQHLFCIGAPSSDKQARAK